MNSRVSPEEELKVNNNCLSYGNRIDLSSTKSSTKIWPRDTKIWPRDSQEPSRLLTVKEHDRSKCSLEQTKTVLQEKNDRAPSKLKMAASIRADVPNS